MIWLVLLVGVHAIFIHGEDVKINIRGPSYEINFKPLPQNKKLNWKFTTDANAKISMQCTSFDISDAKAGDCSNGMLAVNTGMGFQNFCGKVYPTGFTSKSYANSMEIKLNTSPSKNGELRCLVQAVTGNSLDQFRNVESYEVDSSEFGGPRGAKGTTCKCGWANKNNQRIVNGGFAKPNEFPWMVSVMKNATDWNFSHWCGGSIITKKHVLTATHCNIAAGDGDWFALVGTNSRTNIDLSKSGTQLIPVSYSTSHEQYAPENLLKNDITILTLASDIKFSQTVGPICLPSKTPNINDQYVLVMGWGDSKPPKMIYPEFLKTANVRAVDFKTCDKIYRAKAQQSFGNDENRLCVYSANRAFCQGDSGGPIVWVDPETNRYTQVGVVSFTAGGCLPDIPVVSTLVSYYYDWIMKTINSQNLGVDICSKA